VATLAVAGPIASVQVQTIVVRISGEVESEPSELPGTDEASCLCEETTVTFTIEAEGPASSIVYSPSSSTIDWTEHDSPYETTANATIEVPADAENGGTVRVSADVENEPGTVPSSEVESAVISIQPPGEGDDESAQPAATDEDSMHASGVPGPGAGLDCRTVSA